MYKSEGRSWGHHNGAGCRGEVLAQSHDWEALKRRSELLTRLLAAHLRLPNPDSSPLLAATGREDTRPQNPEGRLGDPEPRGASGLASSHTLPRETPALSRLSGPSCSAGPAASRWALGRQTPSPSPEAAPSGGWSPAREGSRGPARGGSLLRRHMWLDLKSY